MARKKELEELNAKYYVRNQELQDEVEHLRNELKKLKEDFVKNYNYVILNKDYIHTEIYKDGVKLERVKFVSIEQKAGNLPEITMEMC